MADEIEARDEQIAQMQGEHYDFGVQTDDLVSADLHCLKYENIEAREMARNAQMEAD